MKLLKTSERVKNFLEVDSKYRDDDNLLYSSILKEDMAEIYPERIVTADMVLYAISKGFTTNSESIRRSRQKIQQSNPHLRGQLWADRHEKLLCETVNELHKM